MSQDAQPILFDVVLDPEAAALVATMHGMAGVLRAPRRAHGPGIIAIAEASAYRCDDDYYYLGFTYEPDRIAANKRILARIREIRREGLRKQNWLLVANLLEEGSFRWLTLAAGTFASDDGEETDDHEIVCHPITLPSGEQVAGPIFGFESAEELDAAAQRLRLRPEFQPEMTLYRLSRPNGTWEVAA
jgi:hypothetical protein